MSDAMTRLDDDDAARQAEEVLRHALDLVAERCNFTPLAEVAARRRANRGKTGPPAGDGRRQAVAGPPSELVTAILGYCGTGLLRYCCCLLRPVSQ